MIKACAGKEARRHSRKHEGVVDRHRQVNVTKVARTCHVALLACGTPAHCSPLVSGIPSPVLGTTSGVITWLVNAARCLLRCMMHI